MLLRNKTRDSTVQHNLRYMHFLLAAFSYSFSYFGCWIPSEMHFHHCFLQASDASVLIAGAATQRTAFVNLRLKGYQVIDYAKTTTILWV